LRFHRCRLQQELQKISGTIAAVPKSHF
jgi:hypothetical protein